MKRFILSLCIIHCVLSTNSQSLAGYPIYDFLMTAVHPYGCDPSYVTGLPDDSIWVNFFNQDTMTGNFGMRWGDRPGRDLLIETGFNLSNYNVRLLLSTGLYSNIHAVDVGDWTQITDTVWRYIEAGGCVKQMITGHHYILPLDFQTDFGLTSTDTVKGIEIVFFNCPGAPDLAGVYIIQEPGPCDTVHLGPDTSLCEGETLFLNATKPNSTYLWQDNSTNATYTVTQAGTYWVTVTEAVCKTYDTIIVSYTPKPAVTNAPLSKTICTGESTNIPLTSNVAGTNFHWTASLTSGNITGFSADSGLVINQVLTNSLATPGIVTYHITPKIGNCVGTTVDFQVTVNQADSVKVSIIASANNICEGTTVTFTAFPTHPGLNPTYHWKVNGVNTGTNSTIFSYTPLNNDVVSCVLTSSLTVCISNNPATSNSITLVVYQNLPVSITIFPDADTVCAGSPVTFTAYPIHGGLTPSYQWKLNGANAGTNNFFYSFIPNDGDLVSCILTSSDTCITNNPASSIQHQVSVSPLLPVSITISPSSNPFCPGNSITFTASPLHGGTPTYQWKVNGINVGTNSITYSYNPANGDSVRCIMTSNLTCVTGNPASSNKIIMSGTLAPIVTFTSCFDTITRINAKPIKLKGGIPLGGIYSGPGVNSITGIFNPAAAGVGTKTITYTYTNAALCSAAKSISILNLPSSILSCGNPLTDIRDNKVYQTIQIGTQCWLAEDLNYGTEIPDVQDQRDNCIAEKYHNPASSIQHPASVYQWDEVMQYAETPAGQGFCPPAWHIPTENEWNTLFAVYINNAFAGSPLKYSGYSGFNALLSGTRHINKSWDYQGFATFFWSSTIRSDNKAWAHGMNDVDPSVSLYPSSRVNAFSVRCLKD